jgi:hypothetical protein
MDAVKVRRRDQVRFKGLIKMLGNEDEDCLIRAELLTLINFIVCQPMDLSTRMALRAEFLNLDILPVLSGLEMMDNVSLSLQLKIFQENQKLDDKVSEQQRCGACVLK